MASETYELDLREDCRVAVYSAMAGPCEIHMAGVDKSEADKLASLALAETRRIEQKYSRYRDDNIVSAINNAHGQPVEVDAETAGLLQFADQCFQISDGKFDITSGVLRRAWKFDGREARPDRNFIDSLLATVGWDRVKWTGESLALQPGMEIDLGGLGKEYAVDRVAQMLTGASSASIMVNFGGDIRVLSSTRESRLWTIGIESPDRENEALGHIELRDGGVATSGDSQRYCLYRNRRLGHILNPLTGWPVAGAPRSITVIGRNCLEAGFLATLAMLQGKEARQFLDLQGVEYHCSG